MKLLYNIHLRSLDQMRGQDLLSHLLKNLADTVNIPNSSILVGNQDKINGSVQKETAEQHMMQVASNAIQEPPNINSFERINLKNIELNCVCDDDMEGIIESSEGCGPHENSKYGHSPSSSSGEDQSRTGRTVFKLFGKDPNDLPTVLRSQILG